MKKLMCFIMLSVGVNFYGQNQTNNILSEQFVDYSNQVFGIDLRDKNLVGSVYIYEEFKSAKMSIDKTIYATNYDAHKDEMVIKKDGKFFAVSKVFNNEINFIGIDKVYRAFTFIDNGKEHTGFFVIISKGENLSLLKKEKIKYFEEVEANTGYEEYKPPSLKRESDKLFLGFKDNSAIELPRKKKDIFKLFKGKEKEIETYVKKEKLNPKKENDLLKMVTEYNKIK